MRLRVVAGVWGGLWGVLLCAGQTGERPQVLARVIEARDAIESGIVEVYQVWTIAGAVRPVERYEAGMFDGDRYRLDIYWDSRFDSIFAHFGLAPPAQFATLVWNGEYVLRRRNLVVTRWSLHGAPAESGLNMYNVRALGMPCVLDPETDPSIALRDAPILEERVEGGLYRVVVRPNRGMIVAQRSDLTLWIDPQRGWSIVRYELREKAYGSTWVVRAESEPGRFGTVWFPQYVIVQQWRDGQWEWTREYYVLRARFNLPVARSEFTWQGTGIRPGDLIESHVIGLPHRFWQAPEMRDASAAP